MITLDYKGIAWRNTINVSDFVYHNITPYYGDASFLEGPTENTQELWDTCLQEMKKERNNNGCLAVDTDTISSITSHKPGYINKDLEKIVGLQTDQLLKRAMKPFGGYRVVQKAVEEKGLKVNPKVTEVFKYAKDHNNQVFSAYD